MYIEGIRLTSSPYTFLYCSSSSLISHTLHPPDLFQNTNVSTILAAERLKRDQQKAAHVAKQERDRKSREVQKQRAQERKEKEKKRTQKQERRRWR